MALESATFIHELNATFPVAGDPVSQGDDHLRLIKAAIKATFAGSTGALMTSATGSWLVPVGTTAQRDAVPAVGMLRVNTTLKALDCYTEGAWRSLVPCDTPVGQALRFPRLNAAENALEFRTAANVLADIGAQAALVSGTNIKTVAGVTILGAGDIAISGLPAGVVVYVAQNTAPAGYLKANGAAVSRTTYAALFTAIGTTFGVGDGATTFNLPDLRGEFIRGWDDGRGADSGRVSGSAQAAANAPHTHGAGTYAAASNGAHTHSTSNVLANPGDGNSQVPGGSTSHGWASVTSSSSGAHTHTLSGDSASSGTEARPRNIALLACIKF